MDFELNERRVTIRQQTDYPWEGRVAFEIQPSRSTRFTLGIRIPGWTSAARLRINGEEVEAESITRKGYARITRTWDPGDRVELEFPLRIERIRAHAGVRQDAGKVALQCGPVVFCLEEIDNGSDLHEIVLPKTSELTLGHEDRWLGEHPVITGPAIRSIIDTAEKLYAAAVERQHRQTSIRAIPYFLWANRGMGEMIVWMRDTA